jgi:simple sugar transport system ATP-binding protein
MLGQRLAISSPQSAVRDQPYDARLATHDSRLAVPTLEVRGLSVLNDRRAPAAREVTLSVAPGEIVGVAGVDGSGQRELAEALVGLRPLAAGSVHLDGADISRASVAARLAKGLAYVPEDRQREGLIMDFSVAENLLLGRQRDRRFGGGTLLSLREAERAGEAAIQEYRIRAPGAGVLARSLSGGNQQKVLLARALGGAPRALIAMQPTRGLDVEATRLVYKTFRDAQAKGLAILLFSLDLDEIFELSDRIAVLYNGALAGIVPRAEATPEEIGRRMVGGQG